MEHVLHQQTDGIVLLAHKTLSPAEVNEAKDKKNPKSKLFGSKAEKYRYAIEDGINWLKFSFCNLSFQRLI